jgi:hypothetical protein
MKHVLATGSKAGYEADLATWNDPAINLAIAATREFEARLAKTGREKIVA